MSEDTPETPEEQRSAPDETAEMAEQIRDGVDEVARDAESAAAPEEQAAAIAEGAAPLDLPGLEPADATKRPPADLDLLADVNLNVKIELGRTQMLVEDVLQLRDGAVVELDKLAGDPVDIYVNERHIARGEVLVLNDTFCVRINEILDAEERMAG